MTAASNYVSPDAFAVWVLLAVVALLVLAGGASAWAAGRPSPTGRGCPGFDWREQPAAAPTARWTCPRGHSVPDGQACDLCAALDDSAGPGLAAVLDQSGYASRDLLAVSQ
jgi:hypothetical protein